MEEKKCPTCSIEKPLSEYHKEKGSKDGAHYECKVCRIKKTKQYYQDKKTEDPEYFIRDRWFRKYKGTFDQYEDYRIATHCACCGKQFSDEKKSLKCQDHDHNTGEIRDIICSDCNLLEGQIKDNPEKLIHMLRYLFKWKTKNTTTQLEKILETFSALFGTH